MDQLKNLQIFLGKAMLATYAGGGSLINNTQRAGFRELEYSESDWYYRDSYAGYIKSVGQEVVWYKDKPYWSQIYGGGMSAGFENNEFADQTFDFLKRVLSTGDKKQIFQPRGPNVFMDNDWRYESIWEGDIKDYKGNEIISFIGKVVFTHDFRGGLIDWGDKGREAV